MLRKILIILFLISIQAQAIESFCTPQVELIIENLASHSYPNESVKSVHVNLEGYSSFHQKQYNAEVSFDSKKMIQKYKVKVFEFENPGTQCIVDELIRVSP